MWPSVRAAFLALMLLPSCRSNLFTSDAKAAATPVNGFGEIMKPAKRFGTDNAFGQHIKYRREHATFRMVMVSVLISFLAMALSQWYLRRMKTARL